jgi:hypothetical protein
MIKALMKLGIEGMYLNKTKAIYDKPTASLILNGKKTQTILSEVRNKTRVFFPRVLFSTPIQYSLGIPSQSNKTGRRNRRNTNWKRSSQIIHILRKHDLIIKRPKKLHQKKKKLLDTKNSLSNVARYKIDCKNQ